MTSFDAIKLLHPAPSGAQQPYGTKKTWLGLGKDEVLAYNTFFGQQVWSNMAGEHLPTLLIILFFISLSRFPPCITILLYFSQIMKVFQ